MFRRKPDPYPPMSEEAMLDRAREASIRAHVAREAFFASSDREIADRETSDVIEALARCEGTLGLLAHEHEMLVKYGGRRPVRSSSGE